MPAKNFTDQRVLNVLDFIVKNNIKKIDTEAKFLKSIGYNNVNNVVNVRKGRQSFKIVSKLSRYLAGIALLPSMQCIRLLTS